MRCHHLLKTFWTGDWSVILAADGSATWTSPTGATYLTHPGSRALFPDRNTTTAPLPEFPTPAPSTPMRGLMMPSRARIRAAERAARIEAERARNIKPDNDSDPPPFSTDPTHVLP